MLKYKLYKDTRSNSQFKGCWYARIAKSDIITTRQLVAHMAKHGNRLLQGYYVGCDNRHDYLRT